MTERVWFIDTIPEFVVECIDPSFLPTDAQLARVHAELEEITSVRLFGENATERARRLWRENQLRGGRTGTIPQNVLAGKGQGT